MLPARLPALPAWSGPRRSCRLSIDTSPPSASSPLMPPFFRSSALYMVIATALTAALNERADAEADAAAAAAAVLEAQPELAAGIAVPAIGKALRQ